MLTGPRPAITPAQIAALLTVIVSQAVAWGWVDNATAKLVISVGGFAIAAVWKGADAYLRGQRARNIPPVVAPTQTTIAPPQ